MNRSENKRLTMVWYCAGAVILYLMTPALLLFEWLYGGGPRASATAGLINKGRPVIIAAFTALVLYDLIHVLFRKNN